MHKLIKITAFTLPLALIATLSVALVPVKVSAFTAGASGGLGDCSCKCRNGVHDDWVYEVFRAETEADCKNGHTQYCTKCTWEANPAPEDAIRMSLKSN